MFANTPNPPYYAVIFSSIRSKGDKGYTKMAKLMEELASVQPGFLGIESAKEGLGITVSYWKDLNSIKLWRENIHHQAAQKQGKKVWYKYYKIRIAKVEREYESSQGITPLP